MADAGKGSKIGGALQDVVTKMLAIAGQEGDMPKIGTKAAAKPSLMTKIGDLKSLFPKKASKQAEEPVA